MPVILDKYIQLAETSAKRSLKHLEFPTRGNQSDRFVNLVPVASTENEPGIVSGS